mgnify:CR=1 FL=1
MVNCLFEKELNDFFLLDLNRKLLCFKIKKKKNDETSEMNLNCAKDLAMNKRWKKNLLKKKEKDKLRQLFCCKEKIILRPVYVSCHYKLIHRKKKIAIL